MELPKRKNNDSGGISLSDILDSYENKHDDTSDSIPSVVIPDLDDEQEQEIYEEIAEAEVSPVSKPEKKHKTKKKHLKKSVLENVIFFGKSLVISLVAVLVVLNFLIHPVQVEGNSMAPTLKNQEYGLSNIIGAKLGHFDRFDIVIIHMEDSGRYLIKRIIGLPGETISYKNDVLYVNGKAVKEPFLDSNFMSAYPQFTSDVEEITLGKDEYFCLGDNRPNSADSRMYGAFKKSQITAKGWLFF